MNRNEYILKVIKSVHVSEKSRELSENQQKLVLKVAGTASKVDIKRAVETLFEVGVESVTTLNVKGKTKRRGARVGKQKDWKKAYVSLSEPLDFDSVGTE